MKDSIGSSEKDPTEGVNSIMNMLYAISLELILAAIFWELGATYNNLLFKITTIVLLIFVPLQIFHNFRKTKKNISTTDVRIWVHFSLRITCFDNFVRM